MEWLNHLLGKLDERATNLFRAKVGNEVGGLPLPGICAVKKKSSSKQMRALIKRLEEVYLIEVKVFEEDMILYEPIENWPKCHCLIAFFSKGFPLEKAEAYANKYKPILINELQPQHLLKDRRHVFAILQANGIPVPGHLIMNRGTYSPAGPLYPVVPNQESDLEEFDDYIKIKGQILNKPFVEKPTDGDDHNVYIYYPRSAGGGSKRLFRKVGNKSSQFYPDENRIRRSGSYIYEEFIATEGTDVKVYVVTDKYAHAEARKSPVVDGMVIRDKNGGEVRYPVRLNTFEKNLARKVSAAFGQSVCGFDLLRSGGKTYVCDVNGWSFVKHNEHYYDDASGLLSELMYKCMGVRMVLKRQLVDSKEDEAKHRLNRSNSFGNNEDTRHEELRCVIGVIRHGDRTPKQKMKMNVTDRRFTSLFDKYSSEVHGGELKLKTAKQLGDVLEVTRQLLSEMRERNYEIDETDLDDVDKLAQMKAVLEMHGTFKGINRKVQLKAKTWGQGDGCSCVDMGKCDCSEKGINCWKGVVEAQLILKWGGVLTALGRTHAESMGMSFRQQLYPGEDGLLRLHSTYRHDLKISSSDEGRVQVTAAAFAKGLLDLQGHLTPILASLVQKNAEVNALLDDASAAKDDLELMKHRLHGLLAADLRVEENQLLDKINPTHAESITKSLMEIGNPYQAMKKLHSHIRGLVLELKSMKEKAVEEEFSTETGQGYNILSGHYIVSEADDHGGGSGNDKQNHIVNKKTVKSRDTPNEESSQGRPEIQIALTETIVQTTRSPSSLPDSVGIPSVGIVVPGHVERGHVEHENSNTNEPEQSDGGSAAASLIKSSTRSLLSSIDNLHLGLARWSKLEKDFYKPKTKKFDLSKIPDIFDAAKYDILHSPALLHSSDLHNIYKISKNLADVIVPQEYGMEAKEKLRIGKLICKNLLKKIRSDIKKSVEMAQKTVDKEEQVEILRGADAIKSARNNKCSGNIENDENTDGETDDEETEHMLDPRYAESMGIKSGSRFVRTRLYFTSESHLHTLFNTFRWSSIIPETLSATSTAYPGNAQRTPIAISAKNSERLSAIKELGYLTHIVIRLYEVFNENSSASEDKADGDMLYPRRFRISVSLSDGTPVHFDGNETGSEDEEIKVPNLGTELKKDIRCYPCDRMVPLWDEIFASDFDHLLWRVLHTDIESLDRNSTAPVDS